MNSITPYQLGVAEVLWSAPDRRLHPLMTSWAVKTENSDCFSVLYFFMCHKFFWQENPSSPHYCCLLTPQVKNITLQQSHGSRNKHESQFVQLSTKHMQYSCSSWLCSEAKSFLLFSLLLSFLSPIPFKCTAISFAVKLRHHICCQSNLLDHTNIGLKRTVYTSWASFVPNLAFLLKLAYSVFRCLTIFGDFKMILEGRRMRSCASKLFVLLT